MKLMYTRLLSGLLSIITTFLLMAAPIAAIVYAAEPVVANEAYTVKEFSNDKAPEFLLKTDWVTNKVNELKPDLLDDTLATALTELTERAQGHDKHK